MPKPLHTIWLIFIFSSLFAQEKPAGSDSMSSSVRYLKNYYSLQRSNESTVYNGKLHYAYPDDIEGIAYFGNDEWQTGSVIYENMLYENIRMKYDLVTDQLILNTGETGGVSLALYSPRVRAFSFSGLTFIYIQDTALQSPLPEGFYQVILNGRVSVIIKNKKSINEETTSSTWKREFAGKTLYYLMKNDRYYPVSKKRDLLNILEEKRKEINDLLNKKKLKFKKNPLEMILAAAVLFNQPTN